MTRRYVLVKRPRRLDPAEEKRLNAKIQLRRSLSAKKLMAEFNVSRSVIDRVSRGATRKKASFRHEKLSPEQLDQLAAELMSTTMIGEN